MKLTNDIRSITIGSFDGIHLAHSRLIDQVDAVVVIERNRGYLTPGYKRSFYIDKPCFFYIFDKIRLLTPEEFVDKLKRDYPNLQKIVIGYDFHFGVKKSGNAQILNRLFDGEVTIVDEVTIDNISVHSRTIKNYLKDGDIDMANRLLSRDYTIEGQIISGQGLGKKELVATLNLSVEEYQLPREGVYATRTLVDGRWLPSVSFLGHRITTDGSFAVETHILDMDIGVLLGTISIEFISSIRENRRFVDLDTLREAIEEDIRKAKDILEIGSL